MLGQRISLEEFDNGKFQKGVILMRKVPTDNDYYNYNGGSCHRIWNQLPHEWRCPACKRTKREVLRWGRSGYKGKEKMQWYASFHKHHDHTKGVERFSRTVLCADCNTADGAAKQKLGLPDDWSFSPSEIAQFVVSRPHAKHKSIKHKVALNLYENATLKCEKNNS